MIDPLQLPATMPAFHPPLLVMLALGVLIAWRIVVRIRRLVTRQRLRPVRAWLGLAFFGYIAVALAARLWLWGQPLGVLAEAAGLAAGAAMAFVGLRRTRYERTDDGLFYTPDARMGMALALLVVARVVWRLGQLALSPQALQEPPDAFLHRPVTLVVLGLMVGYYATYSAGLLRWRRRVA